MRIKYAFIIAIILTACGKQEASISKYDDCVLKMMKEINASSSSIEQIKSSCKNKNPINFDFDKISEIANVKKWKDVAASDEFNKEDAGIQQQIKTQYFNEVIKPRIHEAYEEEAKVQFEAFTRKK